MLDATRFDGLTGERGYDNYPSFEFSGDNCQMLNSFKQGDIVVVSFDLQGMKYEKEGQTRFFTSIRGYKIELKQASQPQQPQQPTYQPPQVEDNTPF